MAARERRDLQRVVETREESGRWVLTLACGHTAARKRPQHVGAERGGPPRRAKCALGCVAERGREEREVADA